MKIAILEPLGVSKDYLNEKIESKIGKGHDITYYPDRKEDEKTLIERSKDADIVVLSNIPYRKAVIEKCENLKMICVAFTGVDHVDVEYCKTKNILVCNCTGYSTSAVADLVFGFVVDLARNVIACDDRARNAGTKDGLVGWELEGKKFGVIGCGAIGTRVAKIADAFGCKVYAYSRSKKDIPGVEFTDLNTLLSECDIVSIHVPQNKDTIGMIGERELSLMKKTSILINTARGPIVDNNALCDALKSGRIAGAGIDVFDMEPPIPKDYPLASAPNTVLTPHVAFASAQAFEKRAVIIADDLKGFIEGCPINIIK